MDEKEKKIRERKHTPIVDGDARPDDMQRAEKFLDEKKKAGKTTRERGADVNSLEDFKDAK